MTTQEKAFKNLARIHERYHMWLQLMGLIETWEIV